MPTDARTDQPIVGKTVHDLQAMAAEAARERTTGAARHGLSRAARLSLIDQLSRWGGSGLAVYSGAAIFIAVVVAREQPFRLAAWLTLLFAAVYVSRRYRKQFRRGDPIAARPFRWLSYYTASLAVVSAAFGAGAFLLVEDAGLTSMRILALLSAALVAAAAFHAAHRSTAAAACLPGLIAVVGAAAATFGPTLLTFAILLGGGLGAVAIAVLAAASERRAALRFPRTTHQRQDIEPAEGPLADTHPAPARSSIR